MEMGRLGRLLITLLLCTEKVLTEPVLYLSLYFKIHRDRYYELLNSTRESGAWESWIEFFLKGVLNISEQASKTAREILTLIKNDRIKISGIGRGADSAMQIYRYLERKPLAVITEIVKELKLSTPTVTIVIAKVRRVRLVREITGKQRGQVFVYDAYLHILDRGTEPMVSYPST